MSSRSEAAIAGTPVGEKTGRGRRLKKVLRYARKLMSGERRRSRKPRSK